MKSVSNLQIIKDYIETKRQISELEERLKGQKESVTAYLLNEENYKVEFEEFDVKLRITNSYKFSKKIQKIEEKIEKKKNLFKESIKAEENLLKMEMDEEITSGVAEVTSQTYVPVVTDLKKRKK